MRSIILIIISILLVAVLLPSVVVIAINESSPKPEKEFMADKCSRYCHDHGCSHKPSDSVFNKIYSSTIYHLKHNPLNLSYKEMNILVFIVLWPLLMLIMLIIIVINALIIKKLKAINQQKQLL